MSSPGEKIWSPLGSQLGTAELVLDLDTAHNLDQVITSPSADYRLYRSEETCSSYRSYDLLKRAPHVPCPPD
ncbi:hypothetical protein EVAR_2273_1 [Eumeta japonica]|uniref:Uncharacterized protein n=1 Tax=Eumeta variegata TaxID=151549 RepID=A0A4C1SGF7_EUMVA|nr:hypothetical protein EVAR_2273_1 [Eumeta japonica]